tara:strand:+ start:466 stop:711 length:246 start_codon:yes stop_codon:yes gene_type:complete
VKNNLKKNTFLIASHVFNENIKKINLNSNMKNIKKWDSVSHLNFIFSLEKEFNLSIEPTDIVKLTSLKRIVDYIFKVKKKR